MQIIHSVQLTNDEIVNLFNLAAIAGEVKVGTGYDEEEKPRLIAAQTAEFKRALSALTHEAFTFGYKAGSNSASVKDTEMYAS